jgi:hypothetical protein
MKEGRKVGKKEGRKEGRARKVEQTVFQNRVKSDATTHQQIV